MGRYLRRDIYKEKDPKRHKKFVKRNQRSKDMLSKDDKGVAKRATKDSSYTHWFVWRDKGVVKIEVERVSRRILPSWEMAKA